MRVHFKALESYSAGSAATQASVANRVELIQMLFDGLIDSLSAARGHIEHKAIEEKSKALTRASRILVGLQSALDFQQGGDLAANDAAKRPADLRARRSAYHEADRCAGRNGDRPGHQVTKRSRRGVPPPDPIGPAALRDARTMSR